MYVIQDGLLIQVPDDAPRPPRSVVVELPHDFHARPEAYQIRKRGIVRRPERELEVERQRAEEAATAAELTPEEITRVKQAIAEGRL
jgi:hypothetical protein